MSIHVSSPPLRHSCECDRNERALSRAESVHCGRLLSYDDNVLSGHGTVLVGSELLASVSGLKVQYSQLYMVEPYKSKYVPKVGDVVVGRIISVQKARWKVDVNYRIAAILHLNNVNLPGGELRRKGLEDEIAMSEHLVVGDLVSAEVQQIKARGQLQLHTRNLKYGKLGQGIFVKVLPSLIKPQKEYMHVLFGIGVTIGCNGVIWISPEMSADPDGGYGQDITLAVPLDKRLCMVRLAACIHMLSKSLICIYDVTISAAYKASMPYKLIDLYRMETHTIIYEIAESASKTALQYESTLRATLCPEQIGRLPRFDILFLGMGPDGHTCSLFPGHRLLQKNDLLTWVVAVTDSPKPPSQRISLTLPVLNAAKNVAFIITGEDKAAMVKTVLDSDVQHVPASCVRPFSKKLRFFLDKGAARLSVFFHRELPEVLPKMPVSRWTNEYEFHFEKASMIDCFIVEELDFFHQYVFVDLLELYDEPLRAIGVHNGCPIYHVVPCFVSERGGCRRLLPMSEVIRYICDSFKPLVTDDEYERVENCTDAELTKALLLKKFQLATNPKKI
ncbi:unnamed protein product [Cylicocyclus nassatus]|uniref:S1 motif domain-containing protein n=1 Tax=Cylicocyclus nassatus TaxID=53992 RepID=A0AA36HG82_CYLNA|nr:unnamed protein product [Cylicocyclus nassatus]